MNLGIRIEQSGKATVIRIDGEIDLYSSPHVRKTIMDLTQKQLTPILIDLEQVRYMDSSGVATLIEGFKQSQKYKGKFILAGLRAEVRQVFELTRLDKVFEIYHNEASALESLAS